MLCSCNTRFGATHASIQPAGGAVPTWILQTFSSLDGDLTNKNSSLIYRLIWVNYNDLTATSLESWLIREIIPKWPYFRLVNYYNLPRLMGYSGNIVDIKNWNIDMLKNMETHDEK